METEKKISAMKRVWYSTALKIAAVVLILSCVGMGAYFLTDGMIRYLKEDSPIYGFEPSFAQSRHVARLLTAPEAEVSFAYEWYDRDAPEQENGVGSFEEYLAERLQGMWASDRVDYFILVNDRIFTNCDAKNADALMKRANYRMRVIDAENSHNEGSATQGEVWYLQEEAVREQGDSVTVVAALTEAYEQEGTALWQAQEREIFETILRSASFALLALVFFVYLIGVCGKRADGGEKRVWIDLIWSELHLGVLIGATALGVIAWAVLLNDGIQLAERFLHIGSVAIAVAVAGIFLISALSLVRKIKHRSFLANSVIFLLGRGIVRLTVRAARALLRWGRRLKKVLFKKSALILCSMLLIYTAMIGACGVLASMDAWGLLCGGIVFLAGGFFVAFRGGDLENVRAGARKIREGDLGYKIENIKSEDMKALAADINEISEGLERSVAERVRAERMKTELITNISHDLKTPLTSIISYTELLTRIENLPKEAKDYVGVIAKKSERLKKLTQDLFDVSKAQSGNEEVRPEKLDVSLLLQQTLGEYDQEIHASELVFCVEIEKNLPIFADGRKLSRVIGNLLENVLKYAMHNTRVFLSASRRDGAVCIELKNISAYPLNFDSEEIVGRFTRGDEARSTEGNGLGLAIAKSYTELCGGHFNVVTDGDLFKAVLTFKEYEA